MAPEQHFGSHQKSNDIYSLGVTMYEMISGELPFKGPDFLAQKKEMVYQRINKVAEGIPDELESVINRTIHADPDKRYSSIEQLHSKLQEISKRIDR